MEPLFEFLFEVGLQVVFEILSSSGVRRAKRDGSEPTSAWPAAIGLACLGCIVGWISALMFPVMFLTSPSSRWANVVLTPIGAGLVMAAIGRRRGRQGKPVGRLERFAFAYLFALGMAVVRLVACR